MKITDYETTLFEDNPYISPSDHNLILNPMHQITKGNIEPIKIPIRKNNVISNIIMGTIGLMGKIYLNYFSENLYLINESTLFNAIRKQNKNECLITISNHQSTIDDPALWGILPWDILFNSKLNRWSLGAQELTYIHPLLNWFFRYGQVIPTVRGAGYYYFIS